MDQSTNASAAGSPVRIARRLLAALNGAGERLSRRSRLPAEATGAAAPDVGCEHQSVVGGMGGRITHVVAAKCQGTQRACRLVLPAASAVVTQRHCAINPSSATGPRAGLLVAEVPYGALVQPSRPASRTRLLTRGGPWRSTMRRGGDERPDEGFRGGRPCAFARARREEANLLCTARCCHGQCLLLESTCGA